MSLPGTRIIRTAGIAAGMAAPVLYVTVVLVLGYLTPGYNPITQLMSELGETGAPYAIVMNLAGIGLSGLLLVLFAAAFALGFAGLRGTNAASALLGMAGLLEIGQAYFTCDAGCRGTSLPAMLHLLIGEVAIFLTIAGCFAVAYVLRAAGWRRLSQYSTATGILVIVLIPVLIFLPSVEGLVQRLIVGCILLWWEILAIAIFSGVRGGGERSYLFSPPGR